MFIQQQEFKIMKIVHRWYLRHKVAYGVAYPTYGRSPPNSADILFFCFPYGFTIFESFAIFNGLQHEVYWMTGSTAHDDYNKGNLLFSNKELAEDLKFFWTTCYGNFQVQALPINFSCIISTRSYYLIKYVILKIKLW